MEVSVAGASCQRDAVEAKAREEGTGVQAGCKLQREGLSRMRIIEPQKCSY